MTPNRQKIYLVDLIGRWCGMHYYLETFSRLFPATQYSTHILSNFDHEGRRAFMPVFFGRSKVVGALLLLWTWFRYMCMILRHRDARFIYLSYGEPRDVMFLLPGLFSRRVVADVHEVHALRYADHSRMAQCLAGFLCHLRGVMLYHSERTLSCLQQRGADTRRMLYLPHLNYCFPRSYDAQRLSDEVRQCFCSEGRRRYLFFGNISTPKGYDIIEDVFVHQLTAQELQRVELVVAGKNVEGFDFSTLRQMSPMLHVIDRHITDDELAYLYTHTDYVLQPYRKSSQSGILAMACHFRKPVLMSDIPYFRAMHRQFPSFGHLADMADFVTLIRDTLQDRKPTYFTPEDCARYEHQDEIQDFLTRFGQL